MAEQDFSKVVQQLQLANRRLENLERLQKEQGTAKGIIAQAAPEIAAEVGVARKREKFDQATGITQTDDAVRDNTQSIVDEVRDLKKITSKGDQKNAQSTAKQRKEVTEVLRENQQGFDALSQTEKTDSINAEIDRRQQLEQQIQLRKELKEQSRKDLETSGKSEEREKREATELKKINLEILSLQQKDPTLSPARRKELLKDEKNLQGSVLKNVFSTFDSKQEGRFKKFFGAKVPGVPFLTVGRLAGLIALPILINFLRSEGFEKLINVLSKPIGPVLDSILEAVTTIGRFFGVIGTGLLSIIQLITGTSNSPAPGGADGFMTKDGKPTGAFGFFLDNFFAITRVLGLFFLLFTPFRLFGALTFMGSMAYREGSEYGGFQPMFDNIQTTFVVLFGSLAGLFKIFTRMGKFLPLIAGGAGAAAMAMSAFGGTAGASYTLGTGKGARTFTLTTDNKFVSASGREATASQTQRLQQGIQSGTIKPTGGTGSTLFKSTAQRYKGLMKFAKIPILGSIISGGLTLAILNSDMDEREKAKAISGLVISTLGTAGIMAVASFLAGTAGTTVGPLGTLAGITAGAAFGFFAGDKVGNFIADNILGTNLSGDDKNPLPDSFKDLTVEDFIPSSSGQPYSEFPGLSPDMVAKISQAMEGGEVSNILDAMAFFRRQSTGGGSGVSNTVFQNSGGNVNQTAYTNHINPTTQINPVLSYIVGSNPLNLVFNK